MKFIKSVFLCLLLTACANPQEVREVRYYTCGESLVTSIVQEDDTMLLSVGDQQNVLHPRGSGCCTTYRNVSEVIVFSPWQETAYFDFAGEVYPICRTIKQ